MNHAIIVAGGRGVRMGAELPKQFLPIAGLPILMHTIRAFAASAHAFGIILVLPNGDMDYWAELCVRHSFDIPHEVVAGGETRFHSVRNGLAAISDTSGVTLVHDGVRPFVSSDLIDRVATAAQAFGAVIPCIAPTDSMRIVQGDTSKHTDRSLYRMVQTPQGFRSALISAAYSTEYSPLFTDDASVVEHHGSPITLVEGEGRNIKITTPTDMLIGEVFMGK